MKICNACNSGNSDNAKFCHKCGGDIENIAPLLNAPSSGIYAPANDYTRMGGWLVFFIVWDIISVASAAFALLQLLIAVINGDGLGTIEYHLSSIIHVIPLLVSVIFRFKRDSRFLLWFQISVILNLLTSVYMFSVSSYMRDTLVELETTYRTLGMEISMTEYLGAIKIFGIIVSIISAGVLFFLITLYYCKSKRVNAFMGNDEYKQKALVKFKSKEKAL
jgi:hypothetical protein